MNGTKAERGDSFVSVIMASPDSYYSISYDLQGGKLPAGKSNPSSYTKESPDITLVNPEKTGYEFAGWTGTGLKTAEKTVTIKSGSTGNREYTATWKATTCTVTFDVQGHGTAPDPKTVVYGKTTSAPKAPKADGYVFGGWYTDPGCKKGTEFKFNSTPVKGDITLYAKWDVAYTLRFHTNGGNSMKDVVLAEDSFYTLKKPARSGYSFVGWYRSKGLKSGDQVKVQHMISKYDPDDDHVIHVYAKWKKMDTTNPKTGDTAFPELAAGVLAFSTVCLGAVTLISKKKRVR